MESDPGSQPVFATDETGFAPDVQVLGNLYAGQRGNDRSQFPGKIHPYADKPLEKLIDGIERTMLVRITPDPSSLRTGHADPLQGIHVGIVPPRKANARRHGPHDKAIPLERPHVPTDPGLRTGTAQIDVKPIRFRSVRDPPRGRGGP